METLYFLGIDISKKMFNAAFTQDGQSMYEGEVQNNLPAIKQYFSELKKKFAFSFDQIIVCLEHTGIYGHPILEYLTKNNIRVCVESALQIIRSQGITRGKNDQVDARRIAQYLYKNHRELRYWKPQRQAIQKLKALLVTRDRLIRAKVQLEVPLSEGEEFIELSIRKENNCCKASISGIKKDIATVDKRINELIKADSHLDQQMKLVTSVPGIGKITAAHVIVSTGEFTRIREAKKFACYSGVAPFEHSSGSSIRGKTRVSKMANMSLKRLLHLAAMSAIQYCDQLKAFYQRKVAEGKNKMSVINAVRNKLISRIFACIRNQRVYQKNLQHAVA